MSTKIIRCDFKWESPTVIGKKQLEERVTHIYNIISIATGSIKTFIMFIIYNYFSVVFTYLQILLPLCRLVYWL